ncbi:hypothetical protein VSX64_20925 [Aurantimonas sp. C2-6-R+9]|uniref:hypothetical protein n=1 Tax=unclassified Aurantimonas TaxID=2638230 RepID=UPI002E188DBF|nr:MULTISPECIES: hypothetical protein [unclassified Aurantimonas]MEC5293704.1 hypothetical protein [Aurantimonas sp. C2-3-R2]MEC5383278.1 hypothetical protein [Aurantimonas sp. C2-6-R+9]MEC5414244.1 hypothetical protein [Aurantimonas sp. C2-4-R8]
MKRLSHLQSCFGSDKDGKTVLAGDRVSVTLSDVKVVRCFKNGGLLVEGKDGKRRPVAAGSYTIVAEARS